MSISAELQEKSISCRRVFTGRALTIDVVGIELPDGRRSEREIVRHRGAVAILGELPDGRFVWVWQYRKAVEAALLEVPAGCLEEGEAPDSAACREMEEETGYRVIELTPLGVSLPCPGYSEEKHFLFHARLTGEPGTLNLDSDENLRPVILTAEQINAAIADGTLTDGKSVVIWHRWLMKKGLCRDN